MEKSHIHFNIGGADNHIFELIVFQCIGRSLNHGKGSIILKSIFSLRNLKTLVTGTYKFVIFDVQEDELGPKVSLFNRLDDFRDIDV